MTINNFMWKYVYMENGTITKSLLEINDGTCRFWGSINIKPNKDGKYEFCAFSRDRNLMTVLPEQYASSIQEATEAIEEFLSNNGLVLYDK